VENTNLCQIYENAIAGVNQTLLPLSFREFVANGFPLTEDDRFTTFDISLAPWFSGLADWVENPDIDWIYLIQGSQTAKTTFLMACLLYYSQFARGNCPIFWASATESEAQLFIKDRLRPFLQQSIGEDYGIDPKKWKMTAFRVFNSFVKVGYATAIATMRSWPARILLGDEIGIWRVPVEYFHKRTRTFRGVRKGIFGSTPPFDGNTASWATVRKADCYQIYVPCPHCDYEQFISFSRIRWYEKTAEERAAGASWDFVKVNATAQYRCVACDKAWDEANKMALIAKGKFVCVDHETHERTAPKHGNARALHLPATYSPFTTWGELAVAFLEAKEAGITAFHTFVTDELAETPKTDDDTDSIEPSIFTQFVVPRKRGFSEGYAVYTMGIDVQGNGALYVVLCGFSPGNAMSAHVLDHQVLRWKNDVGVPDFSALLEYVAPFRHRIYCALFDATDGVTRPDTQNFCAQAGHPFYMLIDRGSSPIVKAEWKVPESQKRKAIRSRSDRFLMVNSSFFKNDLLAAMERDPAGSDAWSFPSDADADFFGQLCNEKRTPGVDNRGKPTYKWVVRYAGAPNHYLSALIYGLAGAEDQRRTLSMSDAARNVARGRRFRNQGVDAWQ
jgi:phage terminase large subunit GpA-like protein